MKKLPTWDLSAIYPDFTSQKYSADLALLTKLREKILSLVKTNLHSEKEEAAWLKQYLELYNQFSDLFDTLYAYAYMCFSTNTNNNQAISAMNKLDDLRVAVKSSLVCFRDKLAYLSTNLAKLIQLEPEIGPFAFFLSEQLMLRSYQLSLNEEELAAELLSACAEPWSRLQEKVSSSLSVVWDAKRKLKKTVTELRTLAFAKEREVRKKAFLLEKRLWESMQIPLAFCLNGVKGYTLVLNKKRSFNDLLEQSLIQARLTRKSLEALIAALHNALPDFRAYFKAKAKALKIKKLAFFDLFAPLPGKVKKWSFEETKAFIVEQFAVFAKDLASLAEKAFSANWIDAELRLAKVGGAYCISLPLLGESRILCNFAQNFGSLTTIAHEFGHAYHHHLLREQPAVLRDYPMTLAETASIFAENLIFEGALKKFRQTDRLTALEHYLQDAAQIVVDILSRYLFESRVCLERKVRELSAEDFCELMLEAQKETYGDALDHKYLHPYMWAVKSHYYRPELPFYNYPYAFGLLLGTALFSCFQKQGKSFASSYKRLLRETGKANCVELTKEFGFDIESVAFWEEGLSVIKNRIKEFCSYF